MNEKQKRMQEGTQRLIDEDIFFRVYNNGWHLVVHDGDDLIDFWPSTGRWVVRDGLDDHRFGVESLIEFIKPGSLLCPVCDGTGEGMASGLTCKFCRGRGEVAR